MKETGMYTPETFTVEMAENLERERRRLQLEVCEYFIKVNDVKSKKGSDFLQHFVDFYHAHLHYLRESLNVMEHFGKTLPDLANSISGLQKQHDTEKRQLVDTREAVRKQLQDSKDALQTQPVNSGYSGTQALPTNLAYGRQKTGFLLKKSDSKVIKRLWQRRHVCVTDTGEFWLYHADETKPPVRLPLLTCQLKLPATSTYTDQQIQPTIDASMVSMDAPDTNPTASNVCKRSFFLVSNNRTYQFQAEDDRDFEEWTNVLSNAMQAAFNEAMQNPDCQSPISDHDVMSNSVHRQHRRGNNFTGSDGDLLERAAILRSSPTSTLCSDDGIVNSLSGAALHQNIQRVMRSKVPGNRLCADCSRPDPEWVSVNLGVLICLECCGTHRELGVQCSRTQSLVMDDLNTAQLMLPRFIGNKLFNSVYESALIEGVKPAPESDSASRRAYIRSKYLDRKYVRERHQEGAIRQEESKMLGVQFHAEGLDLTSPLNIDCDSSSEVKVEAGDTPLHAAISAVANAVRHHRPPSIHLAIVQFILQNVPSSVTLLQRANKDGEIALHYAAKYGLPDALRLLLGVIGGVGIGAVGAVGGEVLPNKILTSQNHLNQTPLSVIEARLSTPDVTESEAESLRRCEHLLHLASEAFCDHPVDSIDFPSAQDQETTARRRLLEEIDDLESVRWDESSISLDDVDDDELTRTFRETLTGALTTSSPTASPSGEFETLPWFFGSPLVTELFFYSISGPGSRAVGYPASCALNAIGCLQSSRPFLKFLLCLLDDWQSLGGNNGTGGSCRRYSHSRPVNISRSAAASALATLPRKKGPAPKPPSNEHASWFTGSTLNSRYTHTMAGNFRASQSPPPTADHIEVLLDVLEEHPSAATPILEDSPVRTSDSPAVSQATSSSALPKQQQQLQRALALYDCDAENPDELTFKRSEIIVVLKAVEVNWWLGYIEGQPNRSGLFPLTHVKLLPLRP
ncbi:hypothetical protein Aperf_G00000104795 [Anoplocephala perfoliata]